MSKYEGRPRFTTDPDKKFTTVDARKAIIVQLNKMRYSGSLMSYGPRLEQAIDSEIDFNDALTDWLISFNEVLIGVADTTTNMAAELQDLRSQKKAIRDFLGLPTDLHLGDKP